MDQRERIGNSSETILAAIEERLKYVWTAIPGIVTAVDLSKMTVQVQPAIQRVLTDNLGNRTYQNPSVLVDVPLIFPCAGPFVLTLPIVVGDEVLVMFSHRCIDSWWQSGAWDGTTPRPQVPTQFRMHSPSDGFAIPGPRSAPNVVPNISPDNLQLRSKDGSVYIEITPGGVVNIKAPSGMNLDGDLQVTGTVQASGEGTFNGHTVGEHVHSGVQTGGGSTGLPVG